MEIVILLCLLNLICNAVMLGMDLGSKRPTGTAQDSFDEEAKRQQERMDAGMTNLMSYAPMSGVKVGGEKRGE